jgi:hypothetical protein
VNASVVIEPGGGVTPKSAGPSAKAGSARKKAKIVEKMRIVFRE